MAQFPFLVSVSVTQPTLRQPTASVYVVANPGDSIGPLTVEIVGVTAGIVAMDNATTTYTYLHTGIPPGATYRVLVYDASPADYPDLAQDFTVDPAPVPVLGCTDSLATNYDGTANADNGSCLYTPPAPLPPFFSVPLLQSLRFVVRSSAAPTSFDTQLFCEQPRPGQQLRPRYYQLVQFDDVVRVQVLTSYAATTATIFHHGGSQVGAPVPLQQVLTLSGPSAPLAVVLSEDVATGLTRLKAAVGGALPPSLLTTPRLTLGGVAAGTYRLTQVVAASVVNLDDYVVLNRPWVAPAAGQVTATWRLIGPGYNVWEADLPLSTLATGYYQVKLRATSAGWPDAVAESEPIHLKALHADTVTLDYRNSDNCFNMVFATGITPRLRLWATFFRQKNGGTEQTYTDSASRLTVLASTATRLTTLEVYGAPAYVHEKVYLACRLDTLVVGGVRQVAPAAYETSELREYALSAGHVDLQQAEWLGAGNGDDLGDDAPDNALILRGGGYLLLRGR